MTETERKVIDILTQHEVTVDAWGSPMYAVDSAMGWASAETREFVKGLIEQRLVALTPLARQGAVYDPKARWEKGGAYPEP